MSRTKSEHGSFYYKGLIVLMTIISTIYSNFSIVILV